MNRIDAQRRLLSALEDPRRYPHPVERVERIETHISTVLLAGDYAYKFKKPIDLGFLDFTSLERRAFFCAEEVRLNGRLAPRVYLDRVTVTGTADAPEFGGEGAPIEYAVRMRRFPQEALLSHIIDAHGLAPELMTRLGERLSAFHDQAAVSAADGDFGTPSAVAAPIRDTLHDLSRSAPQPERGRVAQLETWIESELRRLEPELRDRLASGRVREGHGDLHLANIALWDGELEIFDGIEFDPALRWIDVMADLGFALMDLEYRGAQRLAWRLLSAYLETSGDYAGLRVLPLYQCYRALVRAKIASIRITQLEGDARAQAEAECCRYLQLATGYTTRERPRLLLTHGLSGSGKSTLAQALVDRIGVVRIRSDLERKRLEGMAPHERGDAAFGAGLYSAASSERTYARLAELADTTLAAGYSPIIDAAFLRNEQFAAFRELAQRHDVPLTVLSVSADPQQLSARVAMRAATGTDASDAGVAVLQQQLRNLQPLPADLACIPLRSDQESWLEQAVQAL